MAALGVLRAWAGAGARPPRTLALVDWADEEGARFGRSLFGSSAFSGTLEPAAVRDLRDADGGVLAEVLAENGVDLDRAPRGGQPPGAARPPTSSSTSSRGRCSRPRACGRPRSAAAPASSATASASRGQASHAGTTPMDRRRDAGLAAAEAALRVEEIGSSHGGVATTGALTLRPGIPTAVAGEAELLVDLRHPEADELAAMLAEALAAARGGRRRARLRGSARSRSGESSRSRSTPTWWRQRAGPALRPPAPTGCSQRRAPRRRRGRAGPARGDGLLPLHRRHQPRRGGGHARGRPGGRDRGVRAAREPGAGPRYLKHDHFALDMPRPAAYCRRSNLLVQGPAGRLVRGPAGNQ